TRTQPRRAVAATPSRSPKARLRPTPPAVAAPACPTRHRRRRRDPHGRRAPPAAQAARLGDELDELRVVSEGCEVVVLACHLLERLPLRDRLGERREGGFAVTQ